MLETAQSHVQQSYQTETDPKKSIYMGSGDAVSSGMDTEQVGQKLCEPLELHSNAKKDARIAEYAHTISHYKGLAVPLLNAAWYFGI